MFAEEMVKLRQELSVAQEYGFQLEKDKERLSGELRLAKDRAGKEGDRAAELEKSLADANRRASEFQKKSEDFTVTVVERDQAVSDLALATEQLAGIRKMLSLERSKVSQTEERLATVEGTLAKRSADFEKAEKTLDAFRQRLEADAVLSQA